MTAEAGYNNIHFTLMRVVLPFIGIFAKRSKLSLIFAAVLGGCGFLALGLAACGERAEPAADRPLLRCIVDGYALLYEVDESCRTVSVLDVEQEESDSASLSAELLAANGRH